MAEIYSVSEINAFIKRMFEQEELLEFVQVQGEVSNFKCYASGHSYFTLKDKDSVLKSVMFKSRMQKLTFKPENGMQVVILGSISVYERDGTYQLYAEKMLPVGVGDIEQLFKKLKDKLTKEGLFDDIHKKALPLLPKSVGIITSPNGAAVRDIIKVAKSRFVGIKLYLAPVRVQGSESEQEIVLAIRRLNDFGVDSIILGRGGGSKEDLWVFNSEAVVRAVFASNVPIVSAVGHETDYTLVDYAADLRAATPSQAAEITVPDVRALKTRLQALNETAIFSVRSKIDRCKMRQQKIISSYIMKKPQLLFADKFQTLDKIRHGLQQTQEQLLKDKKANLKEIITQINANNPLNILAKGYAGISANDKIVKSAHSVAVGDEIVLVLKDGSLKAQVTEKEFKELC